MSKNQCEDVLLITGIICKYFKSARIVNEISIGKATSIIINIPEPLPQVMHVGHDLDNEITLITWLLVIRDDTYTKHELKKIVKNTYKSLKTLIPEVYSVDLHNRPKTIILECGVATVDPNEPNTFKKVLKQPFFRTEFDGYGKETKRK